MMNVRHGWVLLIGTMLLGGCYAGADAAVDEESLGSASQASTTLNGTTLNGTTLNGTTLNGTTLNGTTLNGTTLNGTTLNGPMLNGTTLNGTTLNGTTLNGTTLNGTTLNGTDFIGATWDVVTQSGGKITLTIDNIVVAPDPKTSTLVNENADVLLYTLSYCTLYGRLSFGKYGCIQKRTICGNDESGTPIPAIPVKGIWGAPANPGGKLAGSNNYFTWACRQGAVAKCVEKVGYKPWKSVVVGADKYTKSLTLDSRHQACVRMIRGDYCGDGVAHTLDGTLIDVYDGIGINSKTSGLADMMNEAEWDIGGAVCVNNERWDYINCNQPSVGQYIAEHCEWLVMSNGNCTYNSATGSWSCPPSCGSEEHFTSPGVGGTPLVMNASRWTNEGCR